MGYTTKEKEKIKSNVCCDKCGKQVVITLISIERAKKRNNGVYICQSCKAKIKKMPPQCTKKYWTPGRRKKHGSRVKNSQKWKTKNRKTITGINNPMFGKKHTIETRQKMSASRRGKIGKHATAWKGGKNSITVRVKGILHKRYHWYELVYQRDGFKCVQCGSKYKIDAHHIKPVWKIIKELSDGKFFKSKNEQVEWLANQPELKDENLENGITLCRECHKKEHGNWGSHYVS